jgi:hypothetical protein
MTIRPVEAEVFHADRQTNERKDRHDKRNRRFCSVSNEPKNKSYLFLGTQGTHKCTVEKNAKFCFTRTNMAAGTQTHMPKRCATGRLGDQIL